MWAFGVTVFYLLTGVPPFGINAKNLKNLYKNIDNVSYSWPRDIKLSDNAKDLISKILVKKESARLSLHEIQSHPFFRQNNIPMNLPLNFREEPPSESFIESYPIRLVK